MLIWFCQMFSYGSQPFMASTTAAPTSATTSPFQPSTTSPSFEATTPVTQQNFTSVASSPLEATIQSATAVAIEAATEAYFRAMSTSDHLSTTMPPTSTFSSTTPFTLPTQSTVGFQYIPGNTSVPIYQAGLQDYAPRSVTSAIIQGVMGLSAEQPLNGPDRVEREQDAATAGEFTGSFDDINYVDIAVLLAGSFYVLGSVNNSIRNLYRFACSRSDPRLIELGYLEPNRSTQVWGWAASVIERSWIPMWWDHQSLRDRAMEAAIDDRWRSYHLEDTSHFNDERTRRHNCNRSAERSSSSNSADSGSSNNSNNHHFAALQGSPIISQEWQDAIERQRRQEE